MTSSSDLGRRPLIGIQYLRGIAALFVAYYHSFGQVPSLQPLFDRYLFGTGNFWSGVDIFFVISGFIMLVTSEHSRPTEFLSRRLVRIVPLYWIFTLLLAAIFLWQPNIFRTTVFSLGNLAKSLFFVPYANPGHGGDVEPLLVPGWSLNFEMFFYLVFALLLLARAGQRVGIGGLIFLSLTLIHFLSPKGALPPAAQFLTDLKIFEFWLGMLIGQLYLANKLRLPRGLCHLLIAIAFLVILARPTSPNDSQLLIFLGTMVPAAIIVLGTVSLEQNFGMRRHRWLLAMGDSSYSMYLSHIFALGIARAVWAKLELSGPSLRNAIGFGLFSMALVIGAAWLVYIAVERPITRELHRRQRRLRLDGRPLRSARSALAAPPDPPS